MKTLALIGLFGLIITWLAVMAFLVAKLLCKNEKVYRAGVR